MRELRQDEEERLKEVERDDYRAPRLFAQITGLRRHEVASLTWPQVDFENETISVVGTGTIRRIRDLSSRKSSRNSSEIVPRLGGRFVGAPSYLFSTKSLGGC